MKLRSRLFRIHVAPVMMAVLAPLALAAGSHPDVGLRGSSVDVAAADALLDGAKSRAGGRRSSSPKEDDTTSDLHSKIDALTRLVEEQQRSMAELQKRLDNLEAREPKPALIPAAAVVEALTNATPPEPVRSPVGRPASKPAQVKQVGLVAGWDENHAFLRSPDGSFETDFNGYSQLDFHGYQSGAHPPNTFLIRRARIALEGRLYRFFEYRIEGDFADTTNTPLRDFYVNIHRLDELQLRFGQTREPFSQEEMRSDNLQDFVERSLVNNLVPSRSPGIMASGVVGKGLFEYQLGVFNGKGLLANNNNGTPDSALRVRFNPWRGSDSFWLKGILFGGAYNQGRNLNGVSVRGLTESRITFFQPETVSGKLYRANGELTWLLGPATFRAEYDQTNQFRDNLGTRGDNLPGVVAKGYMAAFTYMLTGETKPDVGAVTPKHNLFGGEGGRIGLGAWELKIRYSNLRISDGTPKSNRADTIYFGVNWYFNRFVQYRLDLGLERFKDPARAPKPGDINFFTVLSRVQLQL